MENIEYVVPMPETSLIFKNNSFFLVSKNDEQEAVNVELEGDAKRHAQGLLANYLENKSAAVSDQIHALRQGDESINVSSVLNGVGDLLKDIYSMEVPASISPFTEKSTSFSSTDYAALCDADYSKYQREVFEPSEDRSILALGSDDKGLVGWNFTLEKGKEKFLDVSLPTSYNGTHAGLFPSGIIKRLIMTSKITADRIDYDHILVTHKSTASYYEENTSTYALSDIVIAAEKEWQGRSRIIEFPETNVKRLKMVSKPTIVIFDAALSYMAHNDKRLGDRAKLYDHIKNLLVIAKSNPFITTIFMHKPDESHMSLNLPSSRLFVGEHSHNLAYRVGIDSELLLKENHAMLYNCETQLSEVHVGFEYTW